MRSPLGVKIVGMWSILNGLLSFIPPITVEALLGACILVTGIGVLMLREWGRRGAVLLIGLNLAMKSLAAIAVVVPTMITAPPNGQANWTGWLTAASALVAGFGFAGWSLWYLLQPSVKAQFAAQGR